MLPLRLLGLRELSGHLQNCLLVLVATPSAFSLGVLHHNTLLSSLSFESNLNLPNSNIEIISFKLD